MIIIVLILAALLFIYFNVIPGKGHTFAAWISLIVTSLCILGIVAHDYNQSLVSSATPNLPLLLYRPLGNGTEKIYLYKTNDSQKKLKAIKLDKVSTKINHSKKPTLQIKTTRYVYSDNFSKIMFSVFGHNNELKQRKYIFAIPSNWKVISTKDMQKLQKQMRERMQARKAAVLH